MLHAARENRSRLAIRANARRVISLHGFLMLNMHVRDCLVDSICTPFAMCSLSTMRHEMESFWHEERCHYILIKTITSIFTHHISILLIHSC